MTYHSDFWLTVAAVAPLILLGQILAVGQTWRSIDRAVKKSGDKLPVAALVGSMLMLILVLISVIVLTDCFAQALRCLSEERDAHSVSNARSMMVRALDLVLLQALLPPFAGAVLRFEATRKRYRAAARDRSEPTERRGDA